MKELSHAKLVTDTLESRTLFTNMIEKFGLKKSLQGRDKYAVVDAYYLFPYSSKELFSLFDSFERSPFSSVQIKTPFHYKVLKDKKNYVNCPVLDRTDRQAQVFEPLIEWATDSSHVFKLKSILSLRISDSQKGSDEKLETLAELQRTFPLMGCQAIGAVSFYRHPPGRSEFFLTPVYSSVKPDIFEHPLFP
ncbi:MAG: hypothetical protein KDK61_08845 [Simkania sp.]|nr:hypothetical protein [Simkania sp.]